MISVKGNEALEWVLFIIADALIVVGAYYDKEVTDLGPCGLNDSYLTLLAFALAMEGLYLMFRYVFRQGSHMFVTASGHWSIVDDEYVDTIDPIYEKGGVLVYPPFGTIKFGVSAPAVVSVNDKAACAQKHLCRRMYGCILGLGNFRMYRDEQHYAFPPHVTETMRGEHITFRDTAVLYAYTVDDFVAVREGSNLKYARDAKLGRDTFQEMQLCREIHETNEHLMIAKAEIKALGGDFTPEAINFGGD